MPEHFWSAVALEDASKAKLVALALAATLAAPTTLHAQQMTCGNAVFQLQQYVAQVNQVANFEYYQGIPAKCGFNGYCAQSLLQQLNYWYSQQTGLVNNWYASIVHKCTNGASSAGRVRGRKGGDGEPPSIDESEIGDLEVDDEDRAVRIRIPSTPQGFK